MSAFDPNKHISLLYSYSSQLEGMIKDEGITPASLSRSLLEQRAVVKSIELIGEQAWLLDKEGVHIEGVPLESIAGMRHRLVHNYEGINWDVVEEVAFIDNPELLAALTQYLGCSQDRDSGPTKPGHHSGPSI